jgi:predicted phage terminase large subunit-like protein
MYLLDLNAAKGTALKEEWLHKYPSLQIGMNWPVVIGVDYASAVDKLKDRERDYFTIAVVKEVPGGGGVLVDGYRGRLLQGEAEEKLKSFVQMYQSTRLVSMEAIGKGEEFVNLLVRTAAFPIHRVTSHRGTKGQRYEKVMVPLFRNGNMWITDQACDFITHFIDEWLTYPNQRHDDSLDAVYMAIMAMTNLAAKREMPDDIPLFERVKKSNPFNSLGRA